MMQRNHEQASVDPNSPFDHWSERLLLNANSAILF